MSNFLLSTLDGGVLSIKLNRPEKRNALNRSLISELRESFTAWSSRNEVVVATLTGAGKVFASGGDLDELRSLGTEEEALVFATESRAALDSIRRFPVPVVAVLNGDALGGGAELALACDLRIAAPNSRIGFLQSTLNITTAWGGGIDLFKLVGSSKAIELLCTATVVDAPSALALGLINAVAPPEKDSAEFAAEYVARLAQQTPQVMRAFKSLAIMHRFEAQFGERVTAESTRFARTWIHEDHWRAVNAMSSRSKRPFAR